MAKEERDYEKVEEVVGRCGERVGKLEGILGE